MSEDGVSAPLEVGVKLIVPKGAKIEGKVFRRLATKDRSKQPASKSGSEAEVQAWSFKNRPAKADSDHAGHLASLRLEFGQRKGGTISGNIYLCVARGQTTMFDETPTKDQRAQGSSGAHTCRLRGLECAAAACGHERVAPDRSIRAPGTASGTRRQKTHWRHTARLSPGTTVAT